MNLILETERLILREFNDQDAQFIVELVNSPGWLEFIGDRNIHSTEDAIVYLNAGPMKSYKDNGFGLAMVEKKDGTSIGMCGLLKRNYLESPDIGFAFLPDFMGQGFAQEIATATLVHAKNHLKLKAICAITVPTNKNSIRLLKKIGFRYQKTILSDDGKTELMLFSN